MSPGGEFTGKYGWWKVGAGDELAASDTVTLGAPGLDGTHVVRGSKLIHLTASDGIVSLVARSPVETVTIPLPDANSAARIILKTAEDFPDDQRWLLVASGEPRLVDWRFPFIQGPTSSEGMKLSIAG